MNAAIRILMPAVAAASCILGQTAFEVATVKPSAVQFLQTSTGEDGSYRAQGASLKFLIATAYGVPEFRIEGGPGWANSQRWDIDMRTGAGRRLSGAALEGPLQALLEQRFHLRAAKESRDGNVYFLEVAKAGIKMKPNPDPAARPGIGFGNGMIGGYAVSVPLMVDFLTRYLGRSVIDRTALTGLYDVHITWTPEVGEGDPLVAGAALDSRFEKRSVFAALEEELGLKLTSGKQVSPLVTILSAERPGEN